METLNKLNAGSRTTEVNAVSNDIIFEFDKNDWTADAHLTNIFNLLKAKNAILSRAINRIKAESALEEKDEVRDEKVRAVYYLIFGFMHHPDLEIKTAAKTLDNVFEHYGLEITGKSYSVESSLIDSLLLEFGDANLQLPISKLPGLSLLISELTGAQLEFQEASNDFDTERAEEGTQESATKVKKEVVGVINDKVVIYLRAMIQVNEPTYGELTRTIAQIIENNNIDVKMRRNKTEPNE